MTRRRLRQGKRMILSSCWVGGCGMQSLDENFRGRIKCLWMKMEVWVLCCRYHLMWELATPSTFMSTRGQRKDSAVSLFFTYLPTKVAGNLSEKELKQSLPGISICWNVHRETLFDLRKWNLFARLYSPTSYQKIWVASFRKNIFWKQYLLPTSMQHK